jgi:hypothetical protein
LEVSGEIMPTGPDAVKPHRKNSLRSASKESTDDKLSKSASVESTDGK